MASKEPVIYMWKQTWKYSAGNRKNVVLYLALSAISNLFIFFQPLILAILLNKIQLEGVTQANLWSHLFIASLFLVTILGSWAFHGPSRVLETRNAYRVKANYKKYMVDGVLALPSEWHVEHHSGDTIDKIEKGSKALHSFAGDGFLILEALIRYVSAIIVLFYFNVGAAVIALVFTIITIQIILQFDKDLRPMYKQIHLADNSAAQKIFDIISNISTVIILRVEKLASSDIFRKLTSAFETHDRATKKEEIKWAIASILNGIMVLAGLSFYLITAVNTKQVVLVGTVAALYQYLGRISDVFFRFASRYSNIVQQKTAFDNAEILSNEFKSKEKANEISLSNWKKLSIRNLTFSYHKNNEELHLSDISMTIKKGENIAFIGESGSGKTTFLKLLRGLYKPRKMDLKLGELSIKGFDNISEQVSLIPQDPELFTTTIRENITLGLDQTDARIMHYAMLARFDKVIERLPRGLESGINERGVNLSGGERQRLALTRGLLASRDKQIILLDEPTSSVDSKNESDIYRNIFAEFKGKTIISTIHRLHLLNQFDTIYLFDRGRIIASGSLEEIKKNEKFKELWKKYTAEKKQTE